MNTLPKIPQKKNKAKDVFGVVFWFLSGALLAFFLLTSFSLIIFEKLNSDVVYPGIRVDNIDLSKKTEQEVAQIFQSKNESIQDIFFTFFYDDLIATMSAKELGFGYNEDLIAKQAISLGRSENLLSNISIIASSYMTGLALSPTYHFSIPELHELLRPIVQKIDKEPVDALFAFQNGRVTTFRKSQEGQMVDLPKIEKQLSSHFENVIYANKTKNIIIPIAVKMLNPEVSTNEANDLGIKELIGKGTSNFRGSIQSRIFNINLASSRVNGVLIPPGEEFSFNRAIGDVSSFTGYKQAYVIQGGKTVLGDGGGVCQVSTTFFRTILDSGLPITERSPHSYRVSYYEQDSPPGLDATIYVPTVDLKFKNDTENHILVQAEVNSTTQQLEIKFYGTSDGRTTNVSEPVVSSFVKAPEDKYEDDPTLPKGVVKQIDFKADGATVSFTRDVVKDGETIISDKFVSSYSPWQSVFLRGTKE
jgi:vancomycin resistance protein YoaR